MVVTYQMPQTPGQLLIGPPRDLKFDKFSELHYNEMYLVHGNFKKLNKNIKGKTVVLMYHQLFIP